MFKDHLCTLSRLRECAVVSHHITVLVEAWNAVFDVLLDWVEWLTRGDLKLCTRSLGNLTHKVISICRNFLRLCTHWITHKKWNVMSWTHLTHKPSLQIFEKILYTVRWCEYLSTLFNFKLLLMVWYRKICRNKGDCFLCQLFIGVIKSPLSEDVKCYLVLLLFM